MKLLSRDEFRNSVFERDNYLCVLCMKPAQDAHHIIERRLFSNGGYFLSNGASVCGECHLKCESTEISVEDVRKAIPRYEIILPEQFYNDDVIDKWGNYILSNGQRTRGELFYDESVQKVIAPYIHLFTKYVKHPRTYHLPWSEGLSKDDIKPSADRWKLLENSYVAVLEKMDGENTTLYNDYYHARSIDSNNHPSRNYAKSIWAGICGEIPDGYRFVVENMYAKHSIEYNLLENYLYGLFVWNEKNVCLSYHETKEWFSLIGLPTPKELYIGKFDSKTIKNLKLDEDKQEGYVVRLLDQFNYSMFKYCVAKYVRANHIQTKHWNCMQIIPNKLKS